MWFKSIRWFIRNSELSRLLEGWNRLENCWIYGEIKLQRTWVFFLHKQKCGSRRQIKRLISLLCEHKTAKLKAHNDHRKESFTVLTGGVAVRRCEHKRSESRIGTAHDKIIDPNRQGETFKPLFVTDAQSSCSGAAFQLISWDTWQQI